MTEESDPATANSSDSDDSTKYDHLFEPQEEVLITPEMRDSWPVLREYEKEWFSPVLAQPEPKQPANYDYFFDYSLPRPEFKLGTTQSGDGGRKPTELTEAAAVKRLGDTSLDPIVIAIIHTYLPKDISTQDAIKAIREGLELREDLARYFLDKIAKNPLLVPERVAVNSMKNPNHTEYPSQMYSRDYAALLAISKIDGTYNEELSGSKGTLPEYDSDKRRFIRGQHQAAADFLLFSRADPIQR